MMMMMEAAMKKKLTLTLLVCLGFFCTIKAEDPPLACGSYTLNPGETVKIQSEGYPSSYPSNQDCTWEFEVTDTDATITINCEVKNLRRCSKSSIQITDGEDLDETFCRFTTSIDETSTDNMLTVHFLADKQGKNDGGFHCTVSASECGSDHSLQPDECVPFQSVNHPDPYPADHQCSWNFEGANPESTLSITCDDVKLRGCGRSALTVSDGDGLNEEICRGTTDIDETSSGNSLNVTFTSTHEGRPNGGGFSCEVCASDPFPMTVSDSCECGKLMPTTRIVGGEETDMHKHPWQAALVRPRNNVPFCGGSIISHLYVVTAAHCVDRTPERRVKVLVGEHDYENPSETDATAKLDVAEIIIHPDYDDSTNENDIALLKLSTPLSFATDEILPICLPPYGDLYEGVDAIATGWGLLEDGGDQPNVLHEVTLPTLSNADCNTLLGGVVTDDMICAGLAEGGVDTCQGDSGGPLITAYDSTNQFYELIGVTSFGFGCAEADSPGVYARVEKFLNWIREETVDSIYCSRPE